MAFLTAASEDSAVLSRLNQPPIVRLRVRHPTVIRREPRRRGYRRTLQLFQLEVLLLALRDYQR